MDYGFCLQVFAFVDPKNAPSPVAELGMVEMSQALDLIDVCYEQVGVYLIFYLLVLAKVLIIGYCTICF